MTDINIGEYIRVLRQARDWTLLDLAERAGLSVSFLSDIERGRTTPSIESLDKIATGLGMTLAIRFMDNGALSFDAVILQSKKWEALRQAFYALDEDE